MKKDNLKSKAQISFPKEKVAEFCRRHHIKKLAIFGSALRPDFRADSDIDVLVEFDPDHVPGLAFFAINTFPSWSLGTSSKLELGNEFNEFRVRSSRVQNRFNFLN